jgi:predicted nucleotidyltransferase
MTSDDIINQLKNHRSEIYDLFKIETIGLFGSYATNEQSIHSDIDLLVSFRKGYKDLFNFLNLKYYLEDLLEKEVDLVNKDGIKPALKKTILRQVIYV